MNHPLKVVALCLLAGLAGAAGEDAQITVRANEVLHPVSRYLTGACIEDVNHEVYGGIDSQMIFGESFAEPAPPPQVRGFNAFGGRWRPQQDVLFASAGEGPKLVSDAAPFADGEVAVEICFRDQTRGNAGLLVRLREPGVGADRFTGYEVALDVAGKVVLARHRNNFEPLQSVPCEVPTNQWIKLHVTLKDRTIAVLVNGREVTRYTEANDGMERGTVALRTWQRDALFRNLVVSTGGTTRKQEFALVSPDGWDNGVSGMWRAMRRGTASGEFRLESGNPFSGAQSQRISFASGEGELGIENQGLNRWGMNVVKGKPYEGFVYARAETPTEFYVALESRDGAKVYAEQRIRIAVPEWRRLDFKLKTHAHDAGGRFAIKLKRPGSVDIGYVFLEPGEWGRFKGLATRRDVAEGLISQGVTVLRQGGCMANAKEYRWKNMIGPRERRPPYKGWWYPHSSNGWGIFDFLNFCEAAGILGVPDVNMGETPQDMVDFIEYVNGSPRSKWGQKRAADGHRAPYGLKYLQLGNEERVNEDYWRKFKPIAEAIWAKDTNIILVVGDFAYGRKITDPFHIQGAAGQISTLAVQQKILRLAKKHDREVWFDVHVGTEGPLPDFGGTFSYIDALEQIAEGAKHRVVIFEFNAGNHSQRRALANALAINAVERDGRIPIATSANCLQPDRQNDNDWDQGLLFLNPAKVWLQPPGYVTQMYSQNYEPQLVRCDVSSTDNTLDVNAKRSVDGKVLTLNAVNPSDAPIAAAVSVTGFSPGKEIAQVTELSGTLSATNTAELPVAVTPKRSSWRHAIGKAAGRYTFPPRSITVIRVE